MDQHLNNLGFKKVSDKCYQTFDKYNITIIEKPFSISANNISSDEITEKINDLKNKHKDNKFELLSELIQWIKEENDIEGFDDIDNINNINNEDKDKSFNYIPELPHNPDRNLIIYTWGKKIHNNCPKKVDKNFNAAIIHGNKHGVDIRKLDGRSGTKHNNQV